jgi:integrase
MWWQIVYSLMTTNKITLSLGYFLVLTFFTLNTGLRYSDVAQLRREHIRLSTNIKIRFRPLPIVTNQGLNRSIKDLCKFILAGKPL